MGRSCEMCPSNFLLCVRVLKHWLISRGVVDTDKLVRTFPQGTLSSVKLSEVALIYTDS